MKHAVSRFFWAIGAQILSLLYGKHRVYVSAPAPVDGGEITPLTRLRDGAIQVFKISKTRWEAHSVVAKRHREERAKNRAELNARIEASRAKKRFALPTRFTLTVWLCLDSLYGPPIERFLLTA